MDFPGSTCQLFYKIRDRTPTCSLHVYAAKVRYGHLLHALALPVGMVGTTAELVRCDSVHGMSKHEEEMGTLSRTKRDAFS